MERVYEEVLLESTSLHVAVAVLPFIVNVTANINSEKNRRIKRHKTIAPSGSKIIVSDGAFLYHRNCFSMI